MWVLLAPLLFLLLLVVLTRPKLAPLTALIVLLVFIAVSTTLFRAYMSVTETLMLAVMVILFLLFSRLEESR